jgi:hypothetical protein
MSTDPNTRTTASDLPEWTEGACADGAVILCDGMRVTISEILAALNERERLRATLVQIRKASPMGSMSESLAYTALYPVKRPSA